MLFERRIGFVMINYEVSFERNVVFQNNQMPQKCIFILFYGDRSMKRNTATTNYTTTVYRVCGPVH